MLGSTMLDVAIGMMFVFLMLSVAVSSIKEVIEGWLKKRAVDLENAIREMLVGDAKRRSVNDIVEVFYNHPLICNLYSGYYQPPAGTALARLFDRPKLPTFIPPTSMVGALMDVLFPVEPGNCLTLQAITQRLETLKTQNEILFKDTKFTVPGHLITALEAILKQGNADISEFRTRIETWFNTSMDAASAWFKRVSQWVMLAIAAVLVTLLNADAVAILQHLSADEKSRLAFVEKATQAKPEPATNSNQSTVEKTLKKLEKDAAGIPLGWGNTSLEGWDHVTKFMGLLISTFAATMGAPFWFDTMNKFVNLRSTMRQPPAAASASAPAPRQG
jgi:hypothetical protein